MSGIFTALEISSSGMTAQRKKMDAVAENIANVDTTRTPEGGAYRRKRALVSEIEDKPNFQSALRRANGKLAQTNSRHLPGVSELSQPGPELSQVEAEVVADENSEFKKIYDPSHPDADADGFVQMPDIEIINEMVDMIAANRTYEANISAVTTAKRMINEALDI
ncbi:MAG TPA: flagellar basal body rod protein FlgC [candidate division Zixibacteria bacterium]|nr:flagellar basal body rod protein FlgC [candidate division Zixibacteria bacterium]